MIFAKKAHIFNKVDNVTRQLESSRTLHGSPASIRDYLKIPVRRWPVYNFVY